MKNIIITTLVVTFLLASFVSADTVNMNVSVNGTANLNISVNADDTLARQMISQTNSELNDTQTDVYGTITGSGPKDLILEEIIKGYGNPLNVSEGLDSIKEICADSSLQQYLSQISDLPPLEFVNYLKGLGYDDEAHINFIWTICQQEYVKQHQGQWLSDKEGVQPENLVDIFRSAIDWLSGRGDYVISQAREIAIILSSYFASQKDLWVLSNKVKQQDIRIEALEKAMDEIAPDMYCKAKLDLMKEYNLSGVKCGANSTMYVNAEKVGLDNYDIISYTTCTESWTCTDWSECINNIQGRHCVDNNNCGTFDSKPVVVRECKVIEQQQQQSVQTSPSEQTQDNGLKSEKLETSQDFPETIFISIIALACIFLITTLYLRKRLDSQRITYSILEIN